MVKQCCGKLLKKACKCFGKHPKKPVENGELGGPSASSNASTNLGSSEVAINRPVKDQKTGLPRYMALKSVYNNKCLRYINEDVQVHGFFQFSGERVVSPFTKLEVEPAKSGNGLVHLKCCYNNKYFVRWSVNHWWIVGGANEPEEDQSKWYCTLFKPEYVDGKTDTVRFKHVQLDRYACLWRAAAPFTDCLFAGSPEQDKDLCDVYTICPWEYLVLAKHVAFKGNNGRYLKVYLDGYPHLQFSAKDIGDDSVRQQVFTMPDGGIRIKNNSVDKFWRRDSSNCIVCDANDTNYDADSVFWPVKLENNVIALRNSGNNNFCKRFTTDQYGENLLSANVPTIDARAKLEVEETVMKRQISDVRYNLLDARIHNEKADQTQSQQVKNPTQQPIESDLTFSLEETKSTTWSNSVGLKLGVEVSFKAGVPFIGEMGFQVSGEVEHQRQWGETKSSTTRVESHHKVTCPPMERLTVRLLVTRATYDVPFSYVQRDILTTGDEVVYNMDDGIFKGVNSIGFELESKEEAL